MRLLAEEGADAILHGGHTRHAPDHHHLVDVAGGQASIGQSLFDGSDRPVDEIGRQLFEFGTAESHDQVPGAAGIGCQVRQVDLGLHRCGELDLGLFGGFLQTLQRLAVVIQIDPIILLELLDEVIHNAQIEVITAQERIAARGADLKDAIAHIEDGNIKRAAAKIIDGDNFIFLLIESIR